MALPQLQIKHGRCRQPELPPEVIQQIISNLAPPQLAVSLRVSRLFYVSGVTQLYRTVNIDLSEEVHPLLYRKACNVKPKGKKESLIGGLAKGLEAGWGSVAAHSIRTPTDRDELPDRFSFTTHLTISSHKDDACTKFPPLDMPNLISLQIEPTFQENDLNICHRKPKQKQVDLASHECSLLQHLRPRRLILGSDTTGLTGSAAGLWSSKSPSFPPPWVKELVVYVGACSGIEIGPEANNHLLDRIPATLERLILIMEPRRQAWAGANGPWVFRRVAGFEGRLNPVWLWRALGRACSTKAQSVEIVGLEAIDRDWAELSLKLEMASVRDMAKASCLRRGTEEAEAKAKAQAVVFTERAPYMRRRFE